jgi:hypothetical protein
MNDDTALADIRGALTEARDGLGHVRLDTPAEQLMARGRRRRARRRVVPAAAGAAAGSLALGLALGLPAGPQPVHVSLAAWSVSTSSGGTVTVTFHELAHPGLLRRTLAKAGVPALVSFRQSCATQPQTQALASTGAATGTPDSLVIQPASLPAGSKLIISILPTDNAGGPLPLPTFNFGLLAAGQTATCSSAGTLHVSSPG